MSSPSPRFLPRPEPHSMACRDLLPPIRNAVYQLLRRLEVAVDQAGSRDTGRAVEQSRSADPTSNLLVTGRRGAGKTTVLLSARYAVENPDAFLKGAAEGDCENFGRCLERLRAGLHWLDPLDLEPLPGDVNLLATLLVRIRGALESAVSKQGRASILEEAAESCWNKVDRLVHDAAFMWSFTRDGDPRANADLEIKAAELYAGFGKSFRDTLRLVSREISRQRRGRGAEGSMALVLPIDNVDRSSNHLHGIIKLAQIISCRELWLVLAGGHADFRLFLERAYTLELSLGDNQRPARDGEDETFMLARRQAAGAERKVIPPGHEIRIDLLTSREALSFQPSEVENSENLYELLSRRQLEKRSDLPALSFLTLFDLSSRLLLEINSDIEKLMSEGASCRDGEGSGESSSNRIVVRRTVGHALTLQARNLLDFWQAIKYVGDGCTHEELVRIAADMLRGSVNESHLPGWACRLLEKVLVPSLSNPKVLDLDLTMVGLRRLFARDLGHKIELARDRACRPSQGANSNYLLRSNLHFLRLHGSYLHLYDPDEPRQVVELPPEVASWFVVLADLLGLSRGSKTIVSDPEKMRSNLRLLSTEHRLVIEGKQLVDVDISWPLPIWPLFLDYDIFMSQWQGFVGRYLSGSGIGKEEQLDSGQQVRLVRAAWVDNVCSVADPETYGCWAYPERLSQLRSRVSGKNVSAAGAVHDYEGVVADKVHKMYEKTSGVPASDQRSNAFRSWVKSSLGLLLFPEFLPVRKGASVSEASHHVPEVWRDRLEYIFISEPEQYQLRRVAVRDAAKRSAAFADFKKLHGDAEARESWLAEVCDAWFSAVGDSDSVNIYVASEEEPETDTAEHEEGPESREAPEAP